MVGAADSGLCTPRRASLAHSREPDSLQPPLHHESAFWNSGAAPPYVRGAWDLSISCTEAVRAIMISGFAAGPRPPSSMFARAACGCPAILEARSGNGETGWGPRVVDVDAGATSDPATKYTKHFHRGFCYVQAAVVRDGLQHRALRSFRSVGPRSPAGSDVTDRYRLRSGRRAKGTSSSSETVSIKIQLEPHLVSAPGSPSWGGPWGWDSPRSKSQRLQGHGARSSMGGPCLPFGVVGSGDKALTKAGGGSPRNMCSGGDPGTNPQAPNGRGHWPTVLAGLVVGVRAVPRTSRLVLRYGGGP